MKRSREIVRLTVRGDARAVLDQCDVESRRRSRLDGSCAQRGVHGQFDLHCRLAESIDHERRFVSYRDPLARQIGAPDKRHAPRAQTAGPGLIVTEAMVGCAWTIPPHSSTTQQA